MCLFLIFKSAHLKMLLLISTEQTPLLRVLGASPLAGATLAPASASAFDDGPADRRECGLLSSFRRCSVSCKMGVRLWMNDDEW